MTKGNFNHPLEGDGLNINLFHYLFKKNKNLESCAVRIPDTVIYEHNFPTAWYYFKDKELKKKFGKELETKAIFDEFMKSEENGHGIIATFLSKCEDIKTGQKVNKIEFFDLEELDDFLFKRKRREHGILQKFISPKGPNNLTIQAIWSPNVILTERRLNIHKLTDRKNFTSFERAVTYEGPSHHSQESLCSPHLEKDIKKICEQIASHFYEVEHKHISRMVLYFKLDVDSALWLMWASSIRIASGNDKPLDLSPKFAKPEHENDNKTLLEVQRLNENYGSMTQLTGSKTFSPEDLRRSGSLDGSLSARAMARLEAMAKNREKLNSDSPMPMIANETEAEEADESVSEQSQRFVELRDELVEVVDDLLYQAYSHFLVTVDRPFYFTMPYKLKETFNDTVLQALLSRLNITKDNENQYILPFGTSLGKIQHEYSLFKDLALQEFENQFHENNPEKKLNETADDSEYLEKQAVIEQTDSTQVKTNDGNGHYPDNEESKAVME